MSKATQISMFFQKWDPFHLQIVSIAVIYASEKIQSINYRQSFLQPVHSEISNAVIDHNLHQNPERVNPLVEKSTHSFNTPEEETKPPDSFNQDLSLDHHPPSPGSLVRAPREEGKSENLLDQEWMELKKNLSEGWLKFILDSFNLDYASLPSELRLEDLNKLSKDIPFSIHLEIVHDLVLLSLSSSHASHQDQSNQSTKNLVNQDLRYSALGRQLIFLVAESLGIDPTTVYGAEKLVAQELFFLMQQETEMASKENHDSSKEDAQLVNSSQSALDAAAVKKKWLRYLGAGAGVVVGGVAIGLTGGLAAPILAPFLVGISGGALGFLATSGGAILIGTLFGLAGGGLTGYRSVKSFPTLHPSSSALVNPL